MPFNLSTSVRMKIYYDDADGNPVDITSLCLSINDIKVTSMMEQTDPFGVRMAAFTPPGKGKMDPITIGGLFKIGDNTFNDLFADRVPEDPDTPSRTLKIDWTGEDLETTSVETFLSEYTRTPNRENGLTRSSVVLQPSGEITETHADES